MGIQDRFPRVDITYRPERTQADNARMNIRVGDSNAPAIPEVSRSEVTNDTALAQFTLGTGFTLESATAVCAELKKGPLAPRFFSAVEAFLKELQMLRQKMRESSVTERATTTAEPTDLVEEESDED